MISANPITKTTHRTNNLARAWIAVAALCGLGCLYVALYYWTAEHVAHSAGASGRVATEEWRSRSFAG